MKEYQEEEGIIAIYGAREHNLKDIDLTIPEGIAYKQAGFQKSSLND